MMTNAHWPEPISDTDWGRTDLNEAADRGERLIRLVLLSGFAIVLVIEGWFIWQLLSTI
ncbi:MAG TPA: hypothetical protein VGA52_10515 [Anaerolineales bacterium]|jgi:hypothetical protein